MHWPAGGLQVGDVVREPFQLTDVLPTILEAVQVSYPLRHKGTDLPPCDGVSLLPSLRGGEATEHALFWEHTGNAAMRRGRWKLVREYPHPWELYDMQTDRAERDDLALQQPALVQELRMAWNAWAERVGVVPWEQVLDGYRAAGKSESDAAG